MTPCGDARKVADLHREHRYDLIMLDLRMPEMDGYQVMSALREIETDGYLPVLDAFQRSAQAFRDIYADNAELPRG